MLEPQGFGAARRNLEALNAITPVSLGQYIEARSAPAGFASPQRSDSTLTVDLGGAMRLVAWVVLIASVACEAAGPQDYSPAAVVEVHVRDAQGDPVSGTFETLSAGPLRVACLIVRALHEEGGVAAELLVDERSEWVSPPQDTVVVELTA